MLILSYPFKVNGVALNDEGRYFFTFNRLSAASDEPQGLFREGKNEGKPSRVQTETNEEEEEFDIVVLALPMTKDKTTLEITGLPEKPVFPGRYRIPSERRRSRGKSLVSLQIPSHCCYTSSRGS